MKTSIIFLIKLEKNNYHATLEGSRGITKTKKHTSRGKGTIRTYEGGLFLITWIYGDLIKIKISIQIIKVGMLS